MYLYLLVIYRNRYSNVLNRAENCETNIVKSNQLNGNQGLQVDYN